MFSSEAEQLPSPKTAFAEDSASARTHERIRSVRHLYANAVSQIARLLTNISPTLLSLHLNGLLHCSLQRVDLALHADQAVVPMII